MWMGCARGVVVFCSPVAVSCSVVEISGGREEGCGKRNGEGTRASSFTPSLIPCVHRDSCSSLSVIGRDVSSRP